MHDAPEESAAQGVDPLGDRLRMSADRFRKTRERASSTSSSSPTAKVSESQSQSGSDSETTHIAPVVSHASWLSSPEAASFFTSPLPPEQDIDFQLRLNITTFGRPSHMHKTIAAVLRDLSVKGHHVDSAYVVIDGEQEEVTEKYRDNQGRAWYDPKYNSSAAVFDE